MASKYQAKYYIVHTSNYADQHSNEDPYIFSDPDDARAFCLNHTNYGWSSTLETAYVQPSSLEFFDGENEAQPAQNVGVS